MREQGKENHDNYNSCLHVTSHLFSVLNELNRLFAEKRYNMPSNSKNAALMHTILSYVNQNLTLALTPELLCDKFHFSRAQLGRNFKNTTGSTMCAYITAKRLLLARAYIGEGMRATEAANACGFRDYSTFYRACCRHFGSTPTGAVLQEDMTAELFRSR